MEKTVIATTNAPGAIGPYSQAIKVNGFIFVSGQIGLAPTTGELVDGTGREPSVRAEFTIIPHLAHFVK